MAKDRGKGPGSTGNPPKSGRAGKGPGNSKNKNVGTHPFKRSDKGAAGYGKGGPGPGNKGESPSDGVEEF